jgi:hypothetical protein
MADLDLRPLSLGEILDRTFSLYRRNFLLFVGIAALPHLLVLLLNLTQTVVLPMFGRQAPTLNGQLYAVGAIGIVVVIARLLAYMFSQGGTVYGVSELYLGRQIGIGQSFGRLRGELGNLFGVLFLNGILVFGPPLICFAAALLGGMPALILLGFVLLIFPGLYFACRLMVCVPAALLENIGPRTSLERSFSLTKNNVLRAFVIYVLYFVLLYAASSLLSWPFLFAITTAQKDPGMLRVWVSLTQVGAFVAETLVSPVLTIAAAVYYYDLRVRKEAFDLQFMMNPTGPIAPGAPGVAKTFS